MIKIISEQGNVDKNPFYKVTYIYCFNDKVCVEIDGKYLNKLYLIM